MKKQILLILIILPFLNSSSRLYSTTIEETDSSNTLMLQEGSKAIQLYLINEISLAYKYHLSHSSALRVQLDVSAHLSNNSVEYKYVLKANDSTAKLDGVVIRDNSGALQITLDYVFYLNPSDNFTVFLGLGPSFSYGRGIVERTYDDKNVVYSQTNYDYKVGLLGSVGMESLVFKNLRIIGQYDLSVLYGQSEIKTDGSYQNSYSTERRINRFVQLSSIKLGIVLYL